MKRAREEHGNGKRKPTYHIGVVVRTVEEAKAFGPFDFIVVTLKALLDVYDTGEIIAPAVEEGKTTIVLIQNGFGKRERETVEMTGVTRYAKAMHYRCGATHREAFSKESTCISCRVHWCESSGTWQSRNEGL